MSKQIIDHGFGVIETRETFYTEEAISKLNQQITELQKQLEEKEKSLEYFKDRDEKASKEIKEKRYKIQNRRLIDTKNNKELYSIDSYIDEPVIDLLNSQDQHITELKQRLKSQPAEIMEKIRKGIKDNIICFWKDEDRKSFNRILKSILEKYGEGK
jgi:predicted  nucleic acid-binding Zn-ribbon protein